MRFLIFYFFAGIGLLAGGCACCDAGRVAEPVRIEATGHDFAWAFRYAGARCATGEVLLPANSRVELALRSDDYAYVFSVPGLRLKEMAVPGLAFTLSFATKGPGRFDFMGDDLCGRPHSGMGGHLVVVEQSRFITFLRGLEKCGDN